jgi:N-acetylglucosamine-6-sulfatase
VAERSRDGDEKEILHDNQEDPYQMANIAEESQELAAQLRGEMEGWLRETEDPWMD